MSNIRELIEEIEDLNTPAEHPDFIIESDEHGNETLLLSEDAEELVTTMASIVESCGYEIDEDMDVEEFLEAVEDLLEAEGATMDPKKASWLRRAAGALGKGIGSAVRVGKSAIGAVKAAPGSIKRGIQAASGDIRQGFKSGYQQGKESAPRGGIPAQGLKFKFSNKGGQEQSKAKKSVTPPVTKKTGRKLSPDEGNFEISKGPSTHGDYYDGKRVR